MRYGIVCILVILLSLYLVGQIEYRAKETSINLDTTEGEE